MPPGEPPLELVVLGSGTALPDPARGPTGLAVRAADGPWWWIDGGSGTLHRSAAAGIDPLALAGGLLSHRHLDHSADLAPLLFARRVARVAATYHLVGGAGLEAHVDALRTAHGHGLDTPLQLTELSLDGPTTMQLGGLSLSTAPANHRAGALHLRLDAGGRSVVFSGDTGPSRALVELARGADLLVCACALASGDPYPFHLDAPAVAEIAATAQPGEVWLTHLYPGVDAAQAVACVAATGVPVRRAADGDRWPALSVRVPPAATR